MCLATISLGTMTKYGVKNIFIYLDAAELLLLLLLFFLIWTSGYEKYKWACCAVCCKCEGPKSYRTRYTCAALFVNQCICLVYLFVNYTTAQHKPHMCVWATCKWGEHILLARCDAIALFTCRPWIYHVSI